MTIKQQGGIFGRNPTFNDVNVDGGLFVGDNVKVNIGDSQDMQLYHDGLNSIIEDAGSGNIEIRSNTAVIRKATNAENHIYCQSNGSVILYHDGVPKIYTQSYGASVSGNLAFDSGSGIDFSATSGTGTSELFDDYEEGNWTPSQGGGLTVVGAFASSGTYTKIGRQVSVIGEMTGATSIAFSSGGAILTGGLPFNAATYGAGQAFNGALSAGMIIAAAGGSSIYGAGTISANSRISFQLTYFV